MNPSLTSLENRINQLGTEKIPFLFVLDYDLTEPFICPLGKISAQSVLYNLRGNTNQSENILLGKKPEFTFQSFPVSFSTYQRSFQKIQDAFSRGDSFLANLTFATPVTTSLTLKEIFLYSRAPYRLWFQDRFVVFSPEPFIRIQNRTLSSYPMKGTISALEPEAEKKILNNPKELAEHITMVDLIRNDLGSVATQIQVSRFRYIEKVKTCRGELLQVSSEIQGELEPGFEKRLGTLLLKLLPAGSITGAPKRRTVEILSQAETSKRGFYTGIFGIFDGQNLDSAVMIRFIEKNSSGLWFRSGGGLTHDSNPESEYHEMKEKIYVPIY